MCRPPRKNSLHVCLLTMTKKNNLKPVKAKKRKLIGYNCKVCRGKKVHENDYAITHFCSGLREPVFSPITKKA